MPILGIGGDTRCVVSLGDDFRAAFLPWRAQAALDGVAICLPMRHMDAEKPKVVCVICCCPQPHRLIPPP